MAAFEDPFLAWLSLQEQSVTESAVGRTEDLVDELVPPSSPQGFLATEPEATVVVPEGEVPKESPVETIVDVQFCSEPERVCTPAPEACPPCQPFRDRSRVRQMVHADLTTDANAKIGFRTKPDALSQFEVAEARRQGQFDVRRSAPAPSRKRRFSHCMTWRSRSPSHATTKQARGSFARPIPAFNPITGSATSSSSSQIWILLARSQARV